MSAFDAAAPAADSVSGCVGETVCAAATRQGDP